MAKSRAIRRTDSDRLRTLLTLRNPETRKPLYTQKEIASLVGVSTRTLRRFKNIPGYKLAPRTFERIHDDLIRNERTVRRDLQRHYDLPPSRVLQVPRVYPSKSGRSETSVFDVRGWTRADIADLLVSAFNTEKFYAWTAKVEVPYGVSRSGRTPEEGDINESEDEEGHEVKDYYMIGPFAMTPTQANRRNIENRLKYHFDAGRNIVEISLIRNK